MNLVLKHVIETVFRLDTVFLLIQFPLLCLCQTEKLDHRLKVNGPFFIVGSLISLCVATFCEKPMFDVGFKVPFFQIVVVHIFNYS